MRREEVFHCRTEKVRDRALGLLASVPLVDEKGRVLVITARRETTGKGASRKRKFHAFVNLIAAYKELPPEAVKKAFKARFCPLVEEVDPITGEITHEPLGVSQLSDEEADELCEKVVQFCGGEWSLPLPSDENEWDLCRAGGLDALIEHRAMIAKFPAPDEDVT